MKKYISYLLPALSGLISIFFIVIISILNISNIQSKSNGIDFIYQQNVCASYNLYAFGQSLAVMNACMYPLQDTNTIPSLLDSCQRMLLAYQELIVSNEDLYLYRQFSDDFTNYQAEVSKWLELEQNGEYEAALDHAREVVYPLFETVSKSLSYLVNYQYIDAQSNAQSGTYQSSSSTVITIIVCSVGCVLCLVSSISSSILNFLVLKKSI